MDKQKLASMIDHTILGANITKEQVVQLCKEAKKYGFASVCTEPYFMNLVSEELADSKVKACTVIGFPFGNTSTEAKVKESEQALLDGTDELDMVINISALKENNIELVRNDIKAVVDTKTVVERDVIVKVIIETCYLTDEEKSLACILSKEAGADYVKTSTGFGSGGASVKDIKLMSQTVEQELGVKASGGVRTYQDALQMIEAGATRIGASAGIKIIEDAE